MTLIVTGQESLDAGIAKMIGMEIAIGTGTENESASETVV